MKYIMKMKGGFEVRKVSLKEFKRLIELKEGWYKSVASDYKSYRMNILFDRMHNKTT